MWFVIMYDYWLSALFHCTTCYFKWWLVFICTHLKYTQYSFKKFFTGSLIVCLMSISSQISFMHFVDHIKLITVYKIQTKDIDVNVVVLNNIHIISNKMWHGCITLPSMSAKEEHTSPSYGLILSFMHVS
jgi:hypothetical protein